LCIFEHRLPMETDEQDVHGEHYGSAIFTRETLAALLFRTYVCQR